jgi:glycosyltransferase involved in cell wall biosynthesis
LKIAALTPEGLVSAIYRAFIPMQELAARGHSVHVEESNELQRTAFLHDFDVVFLWRICTDSMLATARRLHDAGVPLVWDSDDDLTLIPRGEPGYRQASGLRGQRRSSAMRQMMRCADVVTTNSPALAERYRAASSADVRVIPNYLPNAFLRTPQRASENVVIGWVAAFDHQRDLDGLQLRPTFERLLARQRDVHLVSIGLELGIESERYHPIPVIRYAELPDYLRQFDIGIAPLLDIPLNRARSNVKLKEYAAVGVPWLASPVGSYGGMGEREGGWLVQGDDWEGMLDDLVDDAAARQRLRTAGSNWARNETIDKHIEAWETVFSDAIERAAHRRGAAARA